MIRNLWVDTIILSPNQLRPTGAGVTGRPAWHGRKPREVAPQLRGQRLGLRNGRIQQHSEAAATQARGVARARQVQLLQFINCDKTMIYPYNTYVCVLYIYIYQYIYIYII